MDSTKGIGACLSNNGGKQACTNPYVCSAMHCRQSGISFERLSVPISNPFALDNCSLKIQKSL